MYEIIDLKIYSPTEMLLDENVKEITFVGKEGRLSILPNHIDYVSSFDANIMNYVDKEGKKKFVAIGNGILVKYANKIRITAYKAIIADSMDELRTKIDNIDEEEKDIEKEINKNLKQLQYYMFNNLINIR